jgi:hypothetical protein
MKINHIAYGIAGAALAASNVLSQSAPFDKIFNACKIECFPAFTAVSSCVHNLNGTYSATFSPANLTVTLDGDFEGLKACACGEDVSAFVGQCVTCANSQGCTPEPLDYSRACAEKDYVGQFLMKYHANQQCQTRGTRRVRRFPA